MKTNCKRCGKPCQTAEKKGSGRPIHKSDRPGGCCGDCAITCYIKTSPLADAMADGLRASGFKIGEALRLPHIQQQFAAVLRVGGAGELLNELNWERVIENWELPVPDGFDWKGEI